MNKPIVWFVGILVLIGAAFIYATSQSAQSQNEIQSPQSQNNIPEVSQSSEASSTLEKYSAFSKEIFENTANKKRVLFFYASWCPTCRPADADFKANAAQIPTDVVLIRVNYNDPETDAEEKALAQKYYVTYQHTFVQIDQKGNKITSWNGGQTTELLANLQ